MRKLESTLARQEFSDTLNRVAYGQDRIVLRRHGKDVAALIPMADLDVLRECEKTLGKRSRRRGKKAGAAPTARKGGPDSHPRGRRQARLQPGARARRAGRGRRP